MRWLIKCWKQRSGRFEEEKRGQIDRQEQGSNEGGGGRKDMPALT
jgi:hypothetical protein